MNAAKFFELVSIALGPIEALGWLSLFSVVIIGCILLILPPRQDRRLSLVNAFAAFLHVQTLVFFLCVPVMRGYTGYLTLSNEPYLFDAYIAQFSIILNFTISGVFLVLVSLRHRTTPKIEWMPAVSVFLALISLFAMWHLRMAIMVKY